MPTREIIRPGGGVSVLQEQSGARMHNRHFTVLQVVEQVAVHGIIKRFFQLFDDQRHKGWLFARHCGKLVGQKENFIKTRHLTQGGVTGNGV